MLYATLIAPFADFEFMRRALVGIVRARLRRAADRRVPDAPPHEPDRRRHGACHPAGRGDRLSVRGLKSVCAWRGGGLIAGFLIAIGAGLVARATPLKEDASLAAFFLVSLALGVTIVSVKGNDIDLMHFLFGSVLAIDNPTLVLILSMTSVSLIVLALIWRPLVLECVDPGFLRSVSRAGGPAHIGFLALVVHQPGRRLPGAWHAACRRHHDAAGGDLAVLGARHYRNDRASRWSAPRSPAMSGLLVSYHANLPSGPAIILVAGALYALSVVAGPFGGLIWLALAAPRISKLDRILPAFAGFWHGAGSPI